jgi:hypothetical protein
MQFDNKVYGANNALYLDVEKGWSFSESNLAVEPELQACFTLVHKHWMETYAKLVEVAEPETKKEIPVSVGPPAEAGTLADKTLADGVEAETAPPYRSISCELGSTWWHPHIQLKLDGKKYKLLMDKGTGEIDFSPVPFEKRKAVIDYLDKVRTNLDIKQYLKKF